VCFADDTIKQQQLLAALHRWRSDEQHGMQAQRAVHREHAKRTREAKETQIKRGGNRAPLDWRRTTQQNKINASNILGWF
jgi:hypothetical protein